MPVGATKAKMEELAAAVAAATPAALFAGSAYTSNALSAGSRLCGRCLREAGCVGAVCGKPAVWALSAGSRLCGRCLREASLSLHKASFHPRTCGLLCEMCERCEGWRLIADARGESTRGGVTLKSRRKGRMRGWRLVADARGERDACKETPCHSLPASATLAAPSTQLLGDVQLLEVFVAPVPGFWTATMIAVISAVAGAAAVGCAVGALVLWLRRRAAILPPKPGSQAEQVRLPAAFGVRDRVEFLNMEI
eukprot:355777-Chlamydomonas_euryale.AAC.2